MKIILDYPNTIAAVLSIIFMLIGIFIKNKYKK